MSLVSKHRDYILNNYKIKTVKQMADERSAPLPTIYNQCRALGLEIKRSNRNEWRKGSKQEKANIKRQFILDNYPSIDKKELAKYFNCSNHYILLLLQELGLVPPKKSRTDIKEKEKVFTRPKAEYSNTQW